MSTYSKGMRQKVAIAVALAKGAEALLLDEPTSGLDPKAANELSNLLRELSRDGVAVLMATHDLFRAKEVGNRLGIMKHRFKGSMIPPHRVNVSEEGVVSRHPNGTEDSPLQRPACPVDREC